MADTDHLDKAKYSMISFEVKSRRIVAASCSNTSRIKTPSNVQSVLYS